MLSARSHSRGPADHHCLALLVLVVTSYALSKVGLGAASGPVALGIAAVKAFLVVSIFMELSEARSSVRLVAAVALFMVLLLVVLTAADPATRAVPPLLPPGG